MSTFMANPQNIERKWWVVDAADKSIGRVAVDVANLLTGKLKTSYTQHADCGDHVIVINADKVVLTGKKADQMYYRTHSGYVGHLKEVKYGILLEKNPELLVKHVVKGMLPKNTLGRNSLARLRVYTGAEHEHAAQKPEVFYK
jgi:large subunit ribosomal protein L13